MSLFRNFSENCVIFILLQSIDQQYYNVLRVTVQGGGGGGGGGLAAIAILNCKNKGKILIA